MQTSGASSRRASNALAPARTVTRRDAFRLLIGAGALAFASPVAAFATSQSDIDAAQKEARRMASTRSSSSSSGPVTVVSGAYGSQAAVISATYSTGSTGAGYCAAWVSNVFANAGVGSFGGNACDMYWSYCTSSNRSSIQAGMIIAVPTEPYSAAARLYGHIGIYVGNETVRHCLSGVITTQSLDSWISQFGVTSTPRWGWLGGVALA